MYAAMTKNHNGRREQWGGGHIGPQDLLKSDSTIHVEIELDFSFSSQTGIFKALVWCEGKETEKLRIGYQFHTNATGKLSHYKK